MNIAAALVAITFAAGFGQEDVRKERDRFIGAWELVEAVRDGKQVEEGVGPKTRYVFAADGTYRGESGESVVGRGTYRPVASKGPAAVDWTTASRNEFDGSFTKEYPSVGIYRFQGDELTVVLKLEGKAEERPTRFESRVGSGWYLIKLRRVR